MDKLRQLFEKTSKGLVALASAGTVYTSSAADNKPEYVNQNHATWAEQVRKTEETRRKDPVHLANIEARVFRETIERNKETSTDERKNYQYMRKTP